MKKINFYLILFVGTVLVLSCQKPIESNLASETSVMSDEMKVVDGILHLPNQKTFDDLTQDLAKKQDKLSDFESKFSGFVSIRTAFAALKDIDAESIAKNGITERYKGFVSVIGNDESKEITRTITDPILATLVNKDGLLRIADQLYKFEYNKFYILKLKNGVSSKVSFDEKSEGVIVGKVTHSTSPNAKVAASTTCIQEYWVGNSKRRMAGDIDYSEYTANGGSQYSNVTIYTKHQKRVFGIWWSTNIPMLSFSGNLIAHNVGSWSSGNWGIQHPINFERACNDCCSEEISFPSQCPSGCAPTVSNVNTDHTAYCSDGYYRTCSISI